MLKINLQEMGEVRIFSEEAIRKMEEALQASLETIQGVMEEHLRAAQAAESSEEMQIDGTPCEVVLATINRQLFVEKRADPKQETLRGYIQEALAKADANLPRYAAFTNLMPKKTWEVKRAGQLNELANHWGGHTSDWVEQMLEFAQQISNGKSWESLCNEADTLDWYRLIWWKNGAMTLMGGSVKNNDTDAPADEGKEKWHAERLIAGAVPLISITKSK